MLLSSECTSSWAVVCYQLDVVSLGHRGSFDEPWCQMWFWGLDKHWADIHSLLAIFWYGGPVQSVLITVTWLVPLTRRTLVIKTLVDRVGLYVYRSQSVAPGLRDNITPVFSVKLTEHEPCVAAQEKQGQRHMSIMQTDITEYIQCDMSKQHTCYVCYSMCSLSVVQSPSLMTPWQQAGLNPVRVCVFLMKSECLRTVMRDNVFIFV